MVGADHQLDSGTPLSRDDAEFDDLNALSKLADALDAAVSSGSWQTLEATALLTGHSPATLDLHQRERDLKTHIASIARICERFVTRLGERAELLPVSRVRRPARRALERLSAHTEDWASRTLTGPVPRRALAITRESDADLYENRMVTELVHPILSTALAQRIHHLRRVQADLADLTRAEDEGTHLRRTRLYRFWGAGAERAATSSNQVGETLRTLEALAAWISSLRGSTLARLVRGRRTGQRALRRTNVIDNDQHYRAAGIVWDAFEKDPQVHETPEDRRQRLLRRHRTFDNYVFGLVVRALQGLGYRPLADHLPGDSLTAAVLGPWGQVTLDRDSTGVLTVHSHGVDTRFVPLLDLIDPDDGPETVAERWQSVQEAATCPTVVVYLAAFDSVRRLPSTLAIPLTSAGLDMPNTHKSTTAVPVSPLETTSLERLARAVAIAVQASALTAYPVTITLPSGKIPRRLIDYIMDANITQQGLGQLFHRPAPDQLQLRRPLTSDELKQLGQVVRQLTARTNSPGWERDLAREIANLSNAVTAADIAVRPLLACPACGTEASPMRVQREGDIFLVTCQSCNARWGHERCGQCRGRIPFIEPEREIRNPDVTGPGWIERILGQDALASPCWARTVPSRYVCPTCRTCSVTGTSDGSNCIRCTDQDSPNGRSVSARPGGTTPGPSEQP